MLNYYGGKWAAGPWIISHFPPHSIYVEAFGGGASILLRKPRSEREVVNDIDREIVNLYRVVRDRGPEFERVCALTPLSRVEYELSRVPSSCDLEQARRTVIKSYFGIGDSVHNASGMRFSRTSNTCVAKSWVNWNSAVREIIDRWQGVLIESLDWRELLDKYDSPAAFFYLDPPYVGSTRSVKHAYRHEFIDRDHHELIERIQTLHGACIVSGYEHDIYQALPWKRVEAKFKTQKKTFRKECLWINPKAVADSYQMEFKME